MNDGAQKQRLQAIAMRFEIPLVVSRIPLFAIPPTLGWFRVITSAEQRFHLGAGREDKQRLPLPHCQSAAALNSVEGAAADMWSPALKCALLRRAMRTLRSLAGIPRPGGIRCPVCEGEIHDRQIFQKRLLLRVCRYGGNPIAVRGVVRSRCPELLSEQQYQFRQEWWL